jgi:sugar O-acyltransferase (sialic acid O-acetyltransferase NeuD family)
LNKNVLIFGTTEIARLIDCYYRLNDNIDVEAYTADKEYLKFSEIDGKPVIPYEDVLNNYSRDKYKIFVGLSYGSFNKNRKSIYNRLRSDGFEVAAFYHKTSSISAYTCGSGNIILDNTTIQPGTVIKENVFISPNCTIGHDTLIDSHAFIGPGVITCGNNHIKECAFVGAGSIIGPGVKLSERSFIGSGSKIFQDTLPTKTYIERSTSAMQLDPKKITSLLYRKSIQQNESD